MPWGGGDPSGERSIANGEEAKKEKIDRSASMTKHATRGSIVTVWGGDSKVPIPRELGRSSGGGKVSIGWRE